ncbi:MAG: CocE/NonD family hydrolase [Bryobacterales bacterium]
MTIRHISTTCALLVAIGVAAGLAQDGERQDPFKVEEVMIPMRDGVGLHTKIFTPKDQAGPLPFIMLRTPYGVPIPRTISSPTSGRLPKTDTSSSSRTFAGSSARGTFVMQRPARRPGDTDALDEGTDTYDTIDWLLQNVPTTTDASVSWASPTSVGRRSWSALEPHPALKAISPQASPADMWLGDDFHHNGAFRLSYAFEYAYMVDGWPRSHSIFLRPL